MNKIGLMAEGELFKIPVFTMDTINEFSGFNIKIPMPMIFNGFDEMPKSAVNLINKDESK